ncbi:MAG: vWA domain-containing protein [Phycisphaerae bacterium]
MKSMIMITATVLIISTAYAATEETAETTKTVTQQPRIEVVFVLDTTGSMGGLIDAAKQKIWSIANTLAMTEPVPQIKMGLVGYRDRGDEYVTKHFALTEDLDAVYEFLAAFKANGGGDTPESVNQAINEAVTDMKWSTDGKTYRVIFLVGDCPPHMDYGDDVKYAESCKLAAEKGIVVNTIQCGRHLETTPIWQDISKRAEGQFFCVEQSGSAIVQSTPFDANLVELSVKLDNTRLFYGSEEDMAEQIRRIERSDKLYEMAPVGASAARAKFNASKAGADNFLGRQELVTDVSSGEVDLDKIETEQLDERLQKMTSQERKEYVAKMVAQRSVIQKQIEELSQKRQEYIKQQIEKDNLNDKDSLDHQLYECIKSQAGKKDIVYTDGPVY